MFFSEKVLPDDYRRNSFFDKIRENYQFVSSGILSKSILGKNIHYFKIGSGKRNVLSVGTHHAMEYITASVLYNVIESFCKNLTRSVSSYGINLELLQQKFTFWFVPCLNPDGVDMHLFGAPDSPLRARQIRMNGSENFSLWQSNARGVDLNHNYDFGFLEYKTLEAENGISAGKTRYSGEYPESEPETKALSGLLKTVMPDLLMTFHTQGELVFVRPRESEKAARIAQRAAQLVGYSLSFPEGLADYGGLSDYAGEVLRIPSLTFEIGRGTNPIDYSFVSSLTEIVYRLHVVLPTLI